MRRLAVLNLAQRIVVVVALAAALRIIWTYVVGRSPGDGWFAYLPLSETPRGTDLGSALLAIGLVVAWACASVWLLGLTRLGRSGGPDSD